MTALHSLFVKTLKIIIIIIIILHSPAYEDGTDSEFRNVGN